MSALDNTPASLLLASASPRRRELLGQIGVSFRALAVPVDETPLPDETPGDYVNRIALAKARAGAGSLREEAAALGADTAVVLGKDILGKPGSPEEAEDMLARLSGRTHRVLTAVALVRGTREVVSLSESQVTFRKTTAAERVDYVNTGEPMDKAGAYAIQGLAAVFIESLAGSYSGVMGLPLYETAALMAEFGIRLPAWGKDARDGTQ